jgi:hypothetical protein
MYASFGSMLPSFPIHEAVVHRDHPVGAPAFDDRLDIRNLAAADRVGQRLVGKEDFVHGAASLGDFLAKQLGDHAGEAAREHHAGLVLLVGRERVDDAVDGFGRVVGVQRAENEHAHRGAAEGEANGFQFPHFTQQEDVRIMAHRAFEGGGE